MIRAWTKGCDEIIDVLDRHRASQLEISRLADKLAECSTRETAGYSDNVVKAASEIPALQRLIEKAESIQTEIVTVCNDAADLMDQCVEYCGMLTDPRHREIIKIFYIYALPMDVAAAKVRYCRRWCEELRDEAISVIAAKVFASVRIKT